ncbi:type II secretion system GspH family protein [Candidatus Parcubacteria bacterium]|nr:type II secretion system GspH family protein [Candidatus Parcubacteria bacterium]
MLKRSQKGFTLIELMTALSIFAVVVTISLGSILNVFDANRKSRALKSVMTNLNLAMEEMSKEMRYGKNYHCGSSGTQSAPQNCPSGDTQVSFLSSDNVQITYRLTGTSLQKQSGNGSFTAVTAPEVLIDSLTYYTLGALTGDGLQPKTLIKLKGHAGSGRGRTDFTIQTLVSERALDS